MAAAKINALADIEVNRKLSRLMEIMRTEELEEVLVVVRHGDRKPVTLRQSRWHDNCLMVTFLHLYRLHTKSMTTFITTKIKGLCKFLQSVFVGRNYNELIQLPFTFTQHHVLNFIFHKHSFLYHSKYDPLYNGIEINIMFHISWTNRFEMKNLIRN